MRGLPARLFGPTAWAVCWNIALFLRRIHAAIYSWESSQVRW